MQRKHDGESHSDGGTLPDLKVDGAGGPSI